jgi:hypothetical protein
MKHFSQFIRFTVIFMAGIVFFASCEKTDSPTLKQGNIEFALTLDSDDAILKSATTDSVSNAGYRLIISVSSDDSVLVFDKKVVPMYRFGEQFISEGIEIATGKYSLIEFMVVNFAGDIIYATPRRGSPLAQLVSNPLPVYFEVKPNAKVQLRVEVVPVGNHPPQEFGYLNFGFSIVRPMKFFTAAIIDNPMIMAPTNLIAAKLEITAPDGWKYAFPLAPKVNELLLRSTPGNYTLVVRTETMEAKFNFPMEVLQNTSPEKPLFLPLKDLSRVKEFVLKTAPDNCADALITNLNPYENFGSVKSFAAFFRPEPVLTVMRTTRSLMFVDVRRQLPKSATIVKVELVLTTLAGPYMSNADSVAYGGVLQQIIEPWDEDSVTWNNQPATTPANQVFIPYQPHFSTIFRTYNITRLFVPDEKVNFQNYGFMFKHSPEEFPGGIEFASSDHERSSYRPYFKVYYKLP